MFLKIITSSLLMLISRLLDRDVMDAIKKLVESYMNFDRVPGKKKKELVERDLQKLSDEFSENLEEISGWILSCSIDIVHAYMEVRR